MKPINPKKNLKKKYIDLGGYSSKKPTRQIFIPEEELTVYYEPEMPGDSYFCEDGTPYIGPEYDPHYFPEYYPEEHPQYMPIRHPAPYPGPHPGYPGPHPEHHREGEPEEEPSFQKRILKNEKILQENRPKKEWIGKVENLDDLLLLGIEVEKFELTNISLAQNHLLNLYSPLDKLNSLIGMDSIKNNIFNQLVFFLQNIEPQFPHMLHTCIEGPPGCGKTELANILADIYANLGIIKEAKVVVARRSDLIAGFLGQTARKTQEVIDSAKGGVLLIDEAYALGNEEKKDSFAKECIDTLNQNLTEGKGDFICIIAGYKEDLEKSFFGFNSGLERRFPYRFSIEEYTHKELCQIFQFILNKNSWKIDNKQEKMIEDFIKDNREHFKFNGGDLENFTHFCKLAYAKNRIFIKNNDKIVQYNDIETAFKMYLQNKKKKSELTTSSAPMSMYC